MTRLRFLLPAVVIILLLVACSPQSNQPVCNKPYIIVGTDCCLDKDDNSICDKDEQQEKKSTITEKSQKVTQTPELSISDVQAGINKVIDGKIFDYTILTKQNSTQDFDFYGDRIPDLVLLAKRSRDNKHGYYKSLDRFGIALFAIKSDNKLIQNQDELVQFVSSNKNYLTQFTESRMIALKEEVNNGDIPIDITKSLQATSLSLSSFSVNNSELLYDQIRPLSTVSNKVVEILQVTLESYNVSYSYKKKGYSGIEYVDLFGIHYLQAYSILCAPNIIITIYANPYARPDRSYRSSLTETNVENHVSQTHADMLEEAQAIVELCEERYDFTYIRDR